MRWSLTRPSDRPDDQRRHKPGHEPQHTRRMLLSLVSRILRTMVAEAFS